MTTFLAIVGFVALFVVFGLFRPTGKGGCGDCSCDTDTCQLEDDSPETHVT